MNIWALQKHDNIKLLLINLHMHVGKENVCLTIEDENNYLSVILEKPDQPEVRAYVSTCEHAEQLYDIHLEYPRLAENGYKENAVIYNELPLHRVLDTLITHLM